MTARRPCPPAPGPLEEYAARFDDIFFSLDQRRGFREYLTGLLAPRERNKTITCLAGAEPVTGARMPGVQRLRFFLSESPWEAEQVNDRRLELLREQPATAPHDGGVMVIDDSGDRKDDTATANVGRSGWAGWARPTTAPSQRHHGVDRQPRVLPAARHALHPRPSLRPRPLRPGLPHETAAVRCPGGPREGGGLRLPGGGRRLRLLESATTGTSHCARPAWPTWWRSSRTAPPGPGPTSRTPPSRPRTP